MLYLALEDPERRLQSRVKKQLAGSAAPARFEYATEWPRLIDEMAGRANLKSTERDAVLAYILVAHSQSR